MKRLRVILLFLLLGAIVNVVVAWGCAVLIDVWSINSHSNRAIEHTLTDTWEVNMSEGFGSTLFVSTRSKGTLVESLPIFRTDPSVSSIVPNWGELSSSSDAYFDATGDEYYFETRIIEGNGWPMRTVWGEYGNVLEDEKGVLTLDPNTRHGMLDTPFPVWKQTGIPRVLPAIPIWTGFILNTNFYAAILWLLIPGPFVFRRLIRHKRGLCVKCAYDLQGTNHEACPECGEEIRKANPA